MQAGNLVEDKGFLCLLIFPHKYIYSTLIKNKKACKDELKWYQ